MVIDNGNTDESIDDLIDDFKFRYIIMSNYQLELYHKKNPLNNDDIEKKRNTWIEGSYYILDVVENRLKIISREPMLSNSTFTISSENDISFLNNYEVSKSYLYQVDKVNPNFGSNGVDKMYGINHIWLAFTYHTKSNKRRMCINRKLFGRYSTIGSREYNLHNLIKM